MAQSRSRFRIAALAVPDGARMPGPGVVAVLAGDAPGDQRTEQLVATAMLGLVQAGWSDEQAARAVERSAGLSHLVTAERGRGWRWLLKRAADARRYAELHPARCTSVALETERARQHLASWRPDPELTGLPQLGKLLAVAHALLTLADELGRYEALSVGCRELAVRASMHESTARKALAAWQQVGLVELTEPAGWHDGRLLAATYRLHLDALTSESAAPVLVDPGATALGGHDAWRHGALGHGALTVWAVLSPAESTDAESLTELLTLRPRAVRELLDRLALHRLAVRTRSGWRRCRTQDAPELLKLAALTGGTDGAGERQRERHLLQRREREYQRARWVQSWRADQRRRETEHLVTVESESWLGETELHRVLVGTESSDGVPLVSSGSTVQVVVTDEPDLTLGELVHELAERGSAVRGWRERLEGSRTVHELREHGTPRTTELALQLQRFGERVARYAEQHPDELAEARAAADAGEGQA